MQNVVREHILALANSKVVKSFYPTGIAKRKNVPLEDVIKELDKLIEEGQVKKRYQLLCLSHNCYRVLDTQDKKEDFKESYECSFCGEEHEEIDEQYIKETFSGTKS